MLLSGHLLRPDSAKSRRRCFQEGRLFNQADRSGQLFLYVCVANAGEGGGRSGHVCLSSK